MFVKFVITFLVIFLMITDSDQMDPLMDEKDSGLCSEKAELIWRFAWRYFKNMHAVAIFYHQDDSVDFSNEILKCSMKNSELSVQYNTSIWNITSGQEKRRLIQGDVYYRHEMNGLIFIKETFENIMTIFPPIDQETKVIIILTNASVDDINNVLTLAWRRYHILDLVIFHTINGTVIMQNDVLDLSVTIYDPFVIKNDITGDIETFPMINDDWLTNKLLKIMSDRLINVRGYPLRVVTCDNRKYKIDKCDNVNCEITLAIIETLNFDPEYYEAKTGEEWIEVEFGRAEITSRTTYILQHTHSYTISLFPIGSKAWHFIVPKMQPGNTISFVKIFSPIVSIALAFSYVIMVVTWRWLQKKNQILMKNGDKIVDLTKICYTLLGNLLQISQPGSGERRYERCLFLSWIIFSMLVCFHYQATMVERLTASDPSRDINTLKELAESDLRILLDGFNHDNLKALAGSMDAPQYYRELLQRTQVVTLRDSTEYAPLRIAVRKDVATMCNIDLCDLLKMMIYSRETGEDAIHIIPEELFSRYSSLIVALDSPYKERFNKILVKMLESGLIQKWWRNYYNKIEREHLMRHVYNPEPRSDVYRMKDLSLIFWSWLGCCCFCSLIFLLELLWIIMIRVRRIMEELPMTLLATFSQ